MDARDYSTEVTSFSALATCVCCEQMHFHALSIQNCEPRLMNAALGMLVNRGCLEVRD